jgi:hypothetical protein
MEYLLIQIKSAASVDDPSYFYYGAGLSGNPQSSATQGYYIKDAQGNIIDAVATNGQTFAASTGVTSSDWSGSIPSSSGNAGVVRTVIDNNDASDWQISSVVPQTLGTYNTQLPLVSSGASCESAKVPLTVNVIGFPTIDAGISAITSPPQSVLSGVQTYLEVELTNFGLNPLTNVDIVYNILGQSSDTLAWTGNLAYGDKDTVLLDSISPSRNFNLCILHKYAKWSS